jgi:voltage-gated potassium channel
VVLPQPEVGPVRAVLQRVVIALVVLVLVATIVWVDRDGYRDVDDQLTFLDALYYSTVSLSTTGYGDITPVTQEARLINILVVTPLRVMFLIVLVGTTLEVLTQRTREQLRQNRWRSSLRDHTIVVGYGTKGRSAVRALLDDGFSRDQIVVVDPRSTTSPRRVTTGWRRSTGRHPCRRAAPRGRRDGDARHRRRAAR